MCYTNRQPLPLPFVLLQPVFNLQILMNNREAAGTMILSMYDGTTPLMTAVKLAVEEMVEQLLNYQVEVNATDNKGQCVIVLCFTSR